MTRNPTSISADRTFGFSWLPESIGKILSPPEINFNRLNVTLFTFQKDIYNQNIPPCHDASRSGSFKLRLLVCSQHRFWELSLSIHPLKLTGTNVKLGAIILHPTSCYVGPQEFPLPETFINPSFQVAHYLWEGKTTQIIKELDKVHKPSYILATPDHTLYISSFLLDQVLYVTDTRVKGSPAMTFTQGHGLDGPWGMVADVKYLYVASFTTDQIHKYDLKTKRFVGAFGNESYLDCPEGMAIGPNDTLYVASFLNDKVVKFSIPDGEFLGMVADKTHGLKGPEDVAFLRDGTLLICSHYTDVVLKFNSSSGENLGVFARVEKPVGLTAGSDGNVYVTSYVSNSILRFNGQTGNFIDVYAAGGGLEGPSSVSFADLRTLYAASYDSDRIVLYNSTTGLSYTLPGKRHEHPGDGSFRNLTLDR